MANLKDKRGQAPNYSGMEGYVAAKVFVKALKRAGRWATRESFIDAIHGMRSVDLGGSPSILIRRNTPDRASWNSLC